MKSRSALAVPLATVLACMSLSGCSDPAALEGFFLTITNSWSVVGETGHTFNLNAVGDDGGRSGEFEGTEFFGLTDPGTDLVGSWADNEVEFIVFRSAGNVTFTGRIQSNHPTELTLSASTGGSIRIRRPQE